MSTKTTQQNIPKGWKQVKLGDALKVGSGKDHKHLKDGNIPVFGTGGLMRHVDTTLHEGETVFIGRKGTIDKPFYFEGKFWTVDTLFYTHSYRDTSAKFINYVFQKINWLAYNEASGVPSLSKTTIEKIPFNSPPLPEQNRIISVLETWDQAIEKLKQKIEIRKDLRSGLRHDLVTGKKRFAGFEEEWTDVHVGNLGKLISGGTPSKAIVEYWEGDIPWISSSDLRENDIHYLEPSRFITNQAIKNSATNLVPENSVVVVSRVGVGKVIVNEEAVCTSQDFQSVVLDRETADPYFLAYLMSLELKKLVSRNQGTSIKGFLKKDLENLTLRIPPLEEQKVISDSLRSLSKDIQLLEEKLHLIKDQKKYLLNNLVTGKIRTPETLSTPK